MKNDFANKNERDERLNEKEIESKK